MKIAALLAALLLVACADPTGVNVPPPPGATPMDTRLRVAPGGRLAVVLPGAGTAGYEWHLADTYDRTVVRLVEKRLGTTSGQPGASAEERFELEGVAAGETTLVFMQYRAWEGPERAIATRRHPVSVR